MLFYLLFLSLKTFAFTQINYLNVIIRNKINRIPSIYITCNSNIRRLNYIKRVINKKKELLILNYTGKPRNYGRVLNSKKNEVDLVPGHSHKGWVQK